MSSPRLEARAVRTAASLSRSSRLRFTRATAAALVLAVLPGATPPPSSGGDPLDYTAAAHDLLTRNGLDPAAVTQSSFHEAMERDCAAVSFGPVRLYVPKLGFQSKDLRGKSYPEGADTMRLAAPAVLRALVQIGRWSGIPESDGITEKELLALVKSIEFDKDFDLAALAQPLTLAQLLGKDVDKREQVVLDKLAVLLALPQLNCTVDGKPPPPIPMLVLPTRKEMIEYLCLAGLAEPTLKEVFHTPAITGWAHSFFGSPVTYGRVHLLCMQEGAEGNGAIERWTEPSEDTEPVLARDLLTFDSLVAILSQQGPAIPNWFSLGMAFQGVLAQHDKMAARLGADSVGDVTPPRQAFVPGGQSNGGQFPKNVSALRGTFSLRDLTHVLEQRKKAAFKVLGDRDSSDPQRKAARAGEEVVYLNFRNTEDNEKDGHLHFGPYVGQDLSFMLQKSVGHDLALIQRALFTLVAGELVAVEKGAAVVRLIQALPGATEPFEELFEKQVGATPTAIERAAFEKIKSR